MTGAEFADWMISAYEDQVRADLEVFDPAVQEGVDKDAFIHDAKERFGDWMLAQFRLSHEV